MLGLPPHTALSEDIWAKKDRRKYFVLIKMSSESIIWYNSKGPFGSAVSILNFPHPGIDTKPIIRYKYKISCTKMFITALFMLVKNWKQSIYQ